MTKFDMGDAGMLIVKDKCVVAESLEWQSPTLAAKRLLLVAIGGFGAWLRYLLQEPS